MAGQEILPSHQVPLGVVQSVNLKAGMGSSHCASRCARQARTAVVSWDNRLEAPQEA